MERATRTDRAPEREVAEAEKDETQQGALRIHSHDALPPVEQSFGAQSARTASDRGFDDAPAPQTVQERSGLLAHKFEAMKGRPQMEAYLAAVSAVDAAIARYRNSSGSAQESRTDVDAAKRAVEVAQKQEHAAKHALHAAAEAWQPSRAPEPAKTSDADGPKDGPR